MVHRVWRGVAASLEVAVVFGLATALACSSVPDLVFVDDDAGKREGGVQIDGGTPDEGGTYIDDAGTSHDSGTPSNTCPGAPPPGTVLCCGDQPCGGNQCNAELCASTCAAKCQGAALCCMGRNYNRTVCRGVGETCP